MKKLIIYCVLLLACNLSISNYSFSQICDPTRTCTNTVWIGSNPATVSVGPGTTCISGNGTWTGTLNGFDDGEVVVICANVTWNNPSYSIALGDNKGFVNHGGTVNLNSITNVKNGDFENLNNGLDSGRINLNGNLQITNGSTGGVILNEGSLIIDADANESGTFSVDQNQRDITNDGYIEVLSDGTPSVSDKEINLLLSSIFTNNGTIVTTGGKTHYQDGSAGLNSQFINNGPWYGYAFESYYGRLDNNYLIHAEESFYMHGDVNNNTGAIIKVDEACGGNATSSCGFYIGHKSGADADFENYGCLDVVDITLKDDYIGTGVYNVSGILKFDGNGLDIQSGAAGQYNINEIQYQSGNLSLISGGTWVVDAISGSTPNLGFVGGAASTFEFWSPSLTFNDFNSTFTGASPNLDAGDQLAGMPTIPACDISSLPIEFEAFFYEKIGQDLFFFFESGLEEDIGYIELQASVNLSQYVTLDIFTPEGGGSLYQSSSHDIPSVTTYYKLVAVGIDGSIHNTSSVVVVEGTVKNDLPLIYPNPATSYINLVFPYAENTLVNVFTANGKLILSRNYIGNSSNSLPVDYFVSGLYLIECIYGSHTVTEYIQLVR